MRKSVCSTIVIALASFNFNTAHAAEVSQTMENTASPFTPDSVLPDGVDVSISTNPYTGKSAPARKGTVAATLNNVARLNKLLMEANREQDVQALIEAIDKLIPSLDAIGVFDLFEPAYWIGEGEQLGRVAAIMLYFKHYPEKLTPELNMQLHSLKRVLRCPYLKSLFDDLDFV